MVYFREAVKKTIKDFVSLAVIVGGGVFLGTLIMIFLYSLPTGRVWQHARESLPLFNTQSLDNWSGNAAYTGLSTYTESIMINNALYRPYESNVKNAMMNSYVYFEDSRMVGSMIRLLTDGPAGGETVDYSRYWHGYLLYLIPGLAFFTIGELKVLMMIVQMLLFSFCLLEFGKRDFLYALLFAAVVMFINPVTTVLTFQEADIYIIMMLFTCLFLSKGKWAGEKQRWKYLFAVNGIMTAFVDFFTYPLVAVGIPLMTYLFMEEMQWKKGIAVAVKSLFFWASGYVGMWSGKWIAAWLLTGKNTFAEGVESVKFRTTGVVGDVNLTYRNVLKCMWDAINEPPMWFLFLVVLAVAGVYIWQGRHFVSLERERIVSCVPVLVVAALPFAYYFVVRNHSVIHPWMEYRELAVTFFGAGLFGIRLILGEKNKRK